MLAIPNLIDQRILIIDDDDPSLFLLAEYLKETNASLYTADCGKTALEIIKNNNFDLILLDIQLGDTSGCDLLPEIRKYSPNAYIVAQTAYAMNNDKLIFLELGFDDYIAKPIEMPNLNNIINNYSNSRLVN